MITPSKLPFTLTFSGGWDKGVRYFNRFTDHPEELAEDRASAHSSPSPSPR